MSRRKKLQLPVSSSSSSAPSSSCSVISSYFKSQSVPEKSIKLSKFIATAANPLDSVESPSPKKSILNFLNLDEDLEKTPIKKVKKAPAPKAKKPKKEKAPKKQPKIKSALLKQEEALSEAITYQSLTEDIDPDELRLALAISRSEAEAKGLPVDDLESLKKFTFTKQAKTTKSWLKGKGKWANKISALTLRDPEVESKKLLKRVEGIIEGFDINLNLPRPTEDCEEAIFIFSSPELCALLDHRKRFNKGETLEAIVSVEEYYIAGLFEPSTAKAGHLLKSYKYIPGRENSPKKNMESVVYEILDDCEILNRIAATSPKEVVEDKENTFQEYDVGERLEGVESKKEDVLERVKTPSLKKKHEASDFQSPCGSPLEKRKKVGEMFRSPDLFCDSDDDDDDGNVLDVGIVEIVSDEEPVIDTFKLPPVKSSMQLFGSEDQQPQTIKTDLEAATLQVEKNDEIFDLTQTLDDSESESREEMSVVTELQLYSDQENEHEFDVFEDFEKQNVLSKNEEETKQTKSREEFKDFGDFEGKPGVLFQSGDESNEVEVLDDSENEKEQKNVLEEPETFDLTQCLDSESEEKNQLRTPSPELFDLTEDIFQEAKDESSDDVIVLSDGSSDEEIVKMKNESLKEILGEDVNLNVSILSSFPNKKPFCKNLKSPETRPNPTAFISDEEPDESPPKKRRSRSYEKYSSSSPEPRRSKSFHENTDSPVNVCNFTFEELRVKYGLSTASTPNNEVPVRKSVSQPAPTSSPPAIQMDDDDFFDKLISSKFKKRIVCDPSIESQSSTTSFTQPIPSTSKDATSTSISLTQPTPSTSKKSAAPKKKPSEAMKKKEETKKKPQKKTKDGEEVVINGKVYIIKTENVPVKPDYARMDKGALSVCLKMYGLKELTRKQSVAILDHIYNQTHPLMAEESDDED